MYWVYPEKKLGQYSGVKIQNTCEIEYKKYCFNGGECFYLIDEDTVGCKYTWLNWRERCEKYMWWTRWNSKKYFFSQNGTCFKIFNSKSDMF